MCLLLPILQKRDDMSSRAYIGQYSADGAFFVAAYQVRPGPHSRSVGVGVLMNPRGRAVT
jgi:hypothetical protein